MSDRIRDNQVKSVNNITQDEHEDRLDAKRVTLVDANGEAGQGSTPSNPLYVQLSDGQINIGTVNAELEVALSHKDNTPDPGDVADSVRIGDGQDELQINPDGSINVNLTPSNTSSTIESAYNEISSVPTNTPTLLVTYTTPLTGITFLQKAFFSGENIAKYQIKINGIVIDTKRTYFGGDLDGSFDFSDASRGRLLVAGDLVEIFVEHYRPVVGDFNGRLQLIRV